MSTGAFLWAVCPTLLNVENRVAANRCSRSVEYIEITAEGFFQKDLVEAWKKRTI
jgi:hypothetical protein